MAEIRLNVLRVESMGSSSSRVTPVFFDDEPPLHEEQQVINVSDISLTTVQDVIGMSAGGGQEEKEEYSGERNPQDAWLPITESRKGNTLTATFHLLCSGIGYQTLLLPMAFISLGWVWGIICLSVAFAWQLYTIWLLVNLHESTPNITGIRYSRYLQLSMVAFAQFFPNLNSLAWISFIGSITAIAYCTMIWIVSVTKGRLEDMVDATTSDNNNNNTGFRNVLNGIGIIALVFRGHNLVLEIQGTIPSNRKKPSRKSMWRGVTISYLMIAMCLFPLAIVGHWAYGNKVTANQGILGAFTKFHKNHTSKYTIGAIYIIIIINYLCAFQIYAMPTFDNWQRIYTTTKNKPCPRWLRSAIKVLFGGLTYFIAVAFPFLPSLSLFIGSITLPLTLAYPCLMWVAIKKPGRFNRMCNLGLGYSGIVLSILSASAALWSLIVDGLHANFFKP
ncbi:hypothetical protein BUALT_Bualt15G0002700 [Buddleja alternifolia]|uniref:Amino acid transporter transmembrane domain-containing protein n=1 Tax=Buddleja alternifolia TaxID=168488 RepID=A0AAV6WJM4_9LAMI|nr:hypothetical protein BUALT_Bualt15G0002700 [Buddleja alternifolia]